LEEDVKAKQHVGVLPEILERQERSMDIFLYISFVIDCMQKFESKQVKHFGFRRNKKMRKKNVEDEEIDELANATASLNI